MNKAKSQAAIDGKLFLRNAFAAEQEVIKLQLELASKTIAHDGVMGDVNEQHFIKLLRRYLPKRYEVDTGIIIDSNGKSSHQIDVVIFDNQYTPTLLDQQSHRYIPAEAVYCILEIKPEINKSYLDYAGDKAKSVRDLERTTIPIIHAGGQYPAKPPINIISGIIAPRVGWKNGIDDGSFLSNFVELQGQRKLDFVLALSDKSFDVFEGANHFGPAKNSLAYFIFRLLQKLQSLGTVPAVDWNKYAEVMSETNSQ
ncbi:DUF6602 domain-containing protein [Shewanella xiamenensis]|uniref:DUF6602 domain-containing protein n=1 Tax=Shewanella xiamenensis TaxID=332186 RepID=UPI001559C2CD|nr:DUF6602 domain-containing protein [Shewanella xiamenensis]